MSLSVKLKLHHQESENLEKSLSTGTKHCWRPVIFWPSDFIKTWLCDERHCVGSGTRPDALWTQPAAKKPYMSPVPWNNDRLGLCDCKSLELRVLLNNKELQVLLEWGRRFAQILIVDIFWPSDHLGFCSPAARGSETAELQIPGGAQSVQGAEQLRKPAHRSPLQGNVRNQDCVLCFCSPLKETLVGQFIESCTETWLSLTLNSGEMLPLVNML